MSSVTTKRPLDFSDYPMIPQHTQESLNRLWLHDIPTGGFLQAIIDNDLNSAFARADISNKPVISDIAMFIYNNMPVGQYRTEKPATQADVGFELNLHHGITLMRERLDIEDVSDDELTELLRAIFVLS